MATSTSKFTFDIASIHERTRRTGTVTSALSIKCLETGETDLLLYEIECQDAATIEWWWPAPETLTIWRPLHSTPKDLPPDWGTEGCRDVRTVRSAPVASLVDAQDRSPATVSLSSSVRHCEFLAGVDEDNGEIRFRLHITDVAPSTDGVCRILLRIDLRRLHFAEALRGVTTAWADELGDRIVPVPRLAREAMYSTWYADHQKVSAKSVERHAASSSPYGCRAIIVDGGWQNNDIDGDYGDIGATYYASCGDWEPDSDRFPDMAAHVARVQQMGHKYLLWIAPPFIGDRAVAWDIFKNQTLGRGEGDRFAVLDPRYPDVRAHIIEACIRPVRDWGVDGLKIDFIDQWGLRPAGRAGQGTDCTTVDEGAELVLAGIVQELQRIRDGVLVEFRQDYVHPRLWQFGTMIRASDCPMDVVENRVRTIDARLLSGDRAVHSDMMMWHKDAPAEVAAMHLINAMFSTPQVSVDLATLANGQEKAVRFWLDFLNQHSETLLSGKLTPSRPDARYTQARAEGEHETIVATFADPLVQLRPTDQRVTVVNGGGDPRILVTGSGTNPMHLTVFDCTGEEVLNTTTSLTSGLLQIDIPICGLACIELT